MALSGFQLVAAPGVLGHRGRPGSDRTPRAPVQALPPRDPPALLPRDGGQGPEHVPQLHRHDAHEPAGLQRAEAAAAGLRPGAGLGDPGHRGLPPRARRRGHDLRRHGRHRPGRPGVRPAGLRARPGGCGLPVALPRPGAQRPGRHARAVPRRPALLHRILQHRALCAALPGGGVGSVAVHGRSGGEAALLSIPSAVRRPRRALELCNLLVHLGELAPRHRRCGNSQGRVLDDVRSHRPRSTTHSPRMVGLAWQHRWRFCVFSCSGIPQGEDRVNVYGLRTLVASLRWCGCAR
mmetsp:Transcript_67742/g.201517  ORF Transcript_67742/g.201517 Transcript_67742/m.201517 type:complete len:293 (-) Transcript_67742:8-886(-)